MKSLIVLQLYIEPIIVVNKSDSFQYYLAVAFILDTFANEDANINLIINLYVYSCFKDKWSFPCDIFKKFAESLSLRKINKLIDRLPPFDKVRAITI